MRYSISYDLQAPEKNYPKLWDALRRANAKRVLDSHWVFRRHNTNAEEMRDHFMQYIDRNDRLMVIGFEGTWASYRAKTDVNDI